MGVVISSLSEWRKVYWWYSRWKHHQSDLHTES